MYSRTHSGKVDSFNSKYKILEQIGEGSFSEVLKCIDRTTGVLFAAKRLKKCYKSESAVSTCAEIVASHKVPFHANILNLLEHHYDSFSGQATFIFELMDLSLYDYLKERIRPHVKRGLSEQKSKEYLYQIMRGLEHLHRSGLFHRDVKPENILIKFPSIDYMRLQRIKKFELVKLADLGSVRGIYSTPPYTEYISTRWYRSPECLLSSGHYGPKMDIWATGCVFFEMLTLLPLFPGVDEIDQLHKIHNVIGTPSSHFLHKLKSTSKNCISFPRTRGTGFDYLLAQADRSTKAFLELMLEYDPDKRISARRILKNSYFDDVRYKFEPPMEGTRNIKNNEHTSNYNRHAYTQADKANYLKMRVKCYDKSSAESTKRSTPSIEIPYYSPAMHPKKQTSLPIVDYKISRYIDSYTRSKSSDSNKSNISMQRNVKKSVEVILRTSRNADSVKKTTSKIPTAQRKKSGSTESRVSKAGKSSTKGSKLF